MDGSGRSLEVNIKISKITIYICDKTRFIFVAKPFIFVREKKKQFLFATKQGGGRGSNRGGTREKSEPKLESKFDRLFDEVFNSEK